MKKEDCINKNIDEAVFDRIVKVFGQAAAEALTPQKVEAIRVAAYEMMSAAVKEFGPVSGIFEEAVDYEYRLKQFLKAE